MRCRAALPFVFCVSAVGMLTSAASDAAAQAMHTVYVAALDKNGAPVRDLVSADFTVKEDGKARDIVKAEPATLPLYISVVVDDNGTGIFRAGLARFIQRLQGRAAIAISTVQPQTTKIVDYTANLEALADGIDRLNARPGTPDGGQLLEGIFESAKDLQQLEVERSVIVALTVGGEEHSTLPAHHVLSQLQRSGATLHVVSVAGSALRSIRRVDKPAALLEENLNLNEVLGDGPRQSGGRHHEIVAAAGLVTGLQVIAEELLNQYAVVYNRPDGAKSSGRISVETKRRGVSLRAPTRVPPR